MVTRDKAKQIKLTNADEQSEEEENRRSKINIFFLEEHQLHRVCCFALRKKSI